MSEPIPAYLYSASISTMPELHYIHVGSQDSNRKYLLSLLCLPLHSFCLTSILS